MNSFIIPPLTRFSYAARTICAALALAVCFAAAAPTIAAQTVQTFTNPAVITINDNAPAAPSPSIINAAGFPASQIVTKVSVTLNNFSHAFPGDVGVLLVSPSGAKINLMYRCGEGIPAANANLTFDDAAVQRLTGAVATGTYKPTRCVFPVTYSAPAPAAPYNNSLFAANGGAANGAWRLYVQDFFSGDIGQIAGGWSLTVTTNAAPAPQTLTVNTAADNESNGCGAGNCTLREAVAAANQSAANDTIVFAAGLSNQPIILDAASGEITIENNGGLTIRGLGANLSTLDGGTGTNRIFYFNEARVTITRLTLQGGNGAGAIESGVGGAIYADGGSLALNAVTVQNNGDAAGFVGGVFFYGGANHRILNSTFSGNTATGCGGFYLLNGNLSVANSTVSGNTANVTTAVAGGGICNEGTMVIRNSTVTNNAANGAGGRGGGVYNGASLNVGNTIIAGNTTAATEPEIYNSGGGFVSAGNNLIGDSAGDAVATNDAITYQPSDILNTPPALGALSTGNGGATATHAPAAGSPAIDTGDNAKAVDPFDNSALTRDQRGYTRIIDSPLFVPIVDIGAFEANAAPTAAVVSIGGRITSGKRGIQNIRITLIDQNGNARTVTSGQLGYYRFADVAAGETYTITVTGKKYSFAESVQIRLISEDTDDVNFQADN